MARRGGMDDYEMERAMDRAEERRERGDDDVLLTFIGIAVVLALIAGGLGWLDNQFGWGTLEWFKGLLSMN